MQYIYHLLTIGLLWLHIAAVTTVAGRRFANWAIGRAVGITLIVMIGFCIEHLVGLGSLSLALPFTTAASIYILWKNQDLLRDAGFLKSEVLFVAALFYGILWKELFPNIYIASERIPDMVFIVHFLRGGHLPPLDTWNPPHLFNYYYSLQYYAAGLAGRILHMSPGLTYNICFALIPALSIPLIWDFSSRFVKSRTARTTLLAAVVIGGTGISILSHVIYKAEGVPEWDRYNTYMMMSSHFIGDVERSVNTPLGRALFPAAPPDKPALSLGMENFGYQYFLGDFHPPMGGYLLLLLALALIGMLEAASNSFQPVYQGMAGGSLTPKHERRLYMALGLTLAAVFAVNTWVFPLHVALVGAWMLWRSAQGYRNRELRPDWAGFMAGSIGGFLLIFLFLIGLSQRDPTPIRLVAHGEHTPIVRYIALFWPLLVLVGLGLLQRETRRLTLFFALVFAGLLVFSEMFFVDDTWSGVIERANTTLKWWGWIWTGGLMALGSLLLAARARAVRICTWVVLGATLVYAYDTVGTMVKINEHTFGHLDGTDIYTRDPVVKEMFQYLEVAPDGIVLENQYDGSYHDGGVYAAFSSKPLLLGWPAHFDRWLGSSQSRDILWKQIKDFYRGELPQARQWLEGKNVRYIVWNGRDAGSSDAWPRINAEISPSYAWEAFGGFTDDRPIGIWVLRTQR